MDRLVNTVRPYAWGSTTALPDLLGVPPTGEPQAELWLGAHPGAPSRLDRGAGPVSLADVIAADPEAELGAETVRAFGPRLPFLFKILAAGAPLSLQVHPDRTQAETGYAAEEARGIPLDAPHRNYKDPHHKPELICALTPFDGLCGFRHPAEAADLLEGLDVADLKPYVDILRASPEESALREVLTAVLGAERHAIAETVERAATAAAHLAAKGGPHAEAYAAYADLAHHHPGDPGILAAMLLNHVQLQPGEALFLGAGIPHAYLNGLGVELMAGLLPPEDVDGEEVYHTPIDEFRLSRFVLAPGGAPRPLPARTPQILLCTAGTVRLTSDTGTTRELTLTPGGSVFAPAGEHLTASGDGTLFRATVVA